RGHKGRIDAGKRDEFAKKFFCLAHDGFPLGIAAQLSGGWNECRVKRLNGGIGVRISTLSLERRPPARRHSRSTAPNAGSETGAPHASCALAGGSVRMHPES